MTHQAKRLKKNIKEMGITDNSGNLSVKTERDYIGTNENGKQMYEYGYAVAHVRALTDEEVEELEERDPLIKISNHPDANFAIIKG